MAFFTCKNVWIACATGKMPSVTDKQLENPTKYPILKESIIKVMIANKVIPPGTNVKWKSYTKSKNFHIAQLVAFFNFILFQT